jgi:nucleoside-diphosphate-sugar epimerase
MICDLAALSNDPAGDLDANLTKQINFEARARLGRIAKAMGVKRYMLASSCSVYGANGDQAATEESQINPLTTYAECNALAEQALFELNDNDFCVTAFRNSTAFGLSPRMRFDLVVNIMTLNAFNSQEITIHGDGLQHRPLIHIADISAAFVKAIASEKYVVAGQIFNLGVDNVTIADLADRVAKTLPMDIDIKYEPNNNDARDYTVSFNKMRNRLGLIPKMQIENGISEIFHAALKGETKLSPDTITLNRYRELLGGDEEIIKHMESISA